MESTKKRILFPSGFFHVWLTVLERHARMTMWSEQRCTWLSALSGIHLEKRTRSEKHALTLLQNVLSASSNLWFRRLPKTVFHGSRWTNS